MYVNLYLACHRNLLWLSAGRKWFMGCSICNRHVPPMSDRWYSISHWKRNNESASASHRSIGRNRSCQFSSSFYQMIGFDSLRLRIRDWKESLCRFEMSSPLLWKTARGLLCWCWFQFRSFHCCRPTGPSQLWLRHSFYGSCIGLSSKRKVSIGAGFKPKPAFHHRDNSQVHCWVPVRALGNKSDFTSALVLPDLSGPENQ